MAHSGSENRKRQKIFTTRLTDQEAALITEQADRAETSLAALIRHAILNQKPPRASRQPSANRKEISRFNAALCDLAQALRDAEKTGDHSTISAQIEAAHRDIADMSHLAHQALGKHS